jgi:MauM/NapG family ferredoxin protein
MKAQTGKTMQRIRIAVQVLFTFLFFMLLLKSGYARAESFTFTDYFFYFDPLILLTNFLSTGTIIPIFLLALIPFFLTFIFGRFFCGWVCPMGALQQFFTWIAGRSPKGKKKAKKKKEGVDKRLLKLKYLILLLLLVAAIMGTHLEGWLDPFSILTRSTALAINPSINYTVSHGLKKGAGDDGVVAKTLKPAYKFARKNVLTIKQRYYTQSVFVGLLFLGFILLNFYKRRFFCNYLCPLGALYGLVSKFSLFNLKPNKEGCVSCNACANNCTYGGSPYQDYMKTECMTCFNCVDDCPTDAVDVHFALPKKEHRTSINVGRRAMLGTAASALFVATLPRIFVHAKNKMIHRFLRPPGSIKEKDFLSVCIRCGQCMHVCPTNFIQPAFMEAGLEGIWTPILNAQTGYCEYECNKCLQVCPTNAIETLDIEKKKKFIMGIAVIDKDRCYTYADGYNCAVCEEHCPIPEKAIRFREVDTWNFKGKLVKVKQIYIVPELCTGCGICEHKCPRSDAPGIIMTSEEEDREFQYG